MNSIELATSFAITRAKGRGQETVASDDLLVGCLHSISRLGVVELGAWVLDLEAMGVDWLVKPGPRDARVSYSEEAVDLLDRAARIAGADGASAIEARHLLAAFAGEESGLMAELKRAYGITSATWRAAIARSAPDAKDAARPDDTAGAYLSPEQAAEKLGIHVQTLRAYVRSGKLPAMRLAGERSIRIRRSDLEKVLEPLVPES
ncbi:MAG TPA: helix-turn-helix domain-containing protein [Bryobacteraceae bacterium]|nr:helix-turn-helix domain-containing protein [Bryobacteraceae bacterium]